ncbi:unnamed protein product [Caenorhabditis angaria]|uniref:Tyrosine-protein phosphatase domain-containing protein n=1 Tax=Caenorhabditis angaria TaxID=860376 RepID=A0A9P1IP60_9PELO|nr:unnamed protein product [Caenorhabditis angaria]
MRSAINPAKKKQEKSVNTNTKKNPLKDALKFEKSKRKTKTEVSTRKEKSVRKKGSKGPTSNNLGPVSSSTNQPTSTPNPSVGSTEQVAWPHESAAKKFLQQNAFQNSRITEEFAAIKTTTPKEDVCAEFFKNPKKNRNAALPITDATRLKLKNPAGGYINAAKISNPADSNRNLIIGQIPETSDLEEFWRMIFDETILHVFFGYAQTDNITTPLATFLPTTMGAFATYGKMFLNVKKVETIGKEINCIMIELLPDGCSNSTLVTVYNQPNWNLGKVPANVSDCIAICEKMNKASDAILFCSWNGVGRAGTMLMIHSVMTHIIKNVDCKIGDLLQTLRGQRFGIVENSEQYLAIYQAIGYWIKAKSSDAETTGKLSEFCAALK